MRPASHPSRPDKRAAKAWDSVRQGGHRRADRLPDQSASIKYGLESALQQLLRRAPETHTTSALPQEQRAAGSAPRPCLGPNNCLPRRPPREGRELNHYLPPAARQTTMTSRNHNQQP